MSLEKLIPYIQYLFHPCRSHSTLSELAQCSIDSYGWGSSHLNKGIQGPLGRVDIGEALAGIAKLRIARQLEQVL